MISLSSPLMGEGDHCAAMVEWVSAESVA